MCTLVWAVLFATTTTVLPTRGSDLDVGSNKVASKVTAKAMVHIVINQSNVTHTIPTSANGCVVHPRDQ